MGDQIMRIGYSHWGFLGAGITDTPDGGRSHRKTLVDGLITRGHHLVFLQADRDTLEAHTPVPGPYEWAAGLPEIDALILEWRWRIPGRNDTPCTAPGHTCDLHRQQQLVSHYTLEYGLPTILWDKDQQLAADDPLRRQRNVAVCEPALYPRRHATSLLFPVADAALDSADPHILADHERTLPLVYVGNQYGRDEDFGEFFAKPARHLPHAVAGKWTNTAAWPHVRFLGRVPFREGQALHRQAHATVLLAPARYAISGQFTQRISEATLAGCAPITPAHYRAAERMVPASLLARDAGDVARITRRLTHMGQQARAELLTRCIRRLDPFRLSRQLDTIHHVLDHLRDAPYASGPPQHLQNR